MVGRIAVCACGRERLRTFDTFVVCFRLSDSIGVNIEHVPYFRDYYLKAFHTYRSRRDAIRQIIAAIDPASLGIVYPVMHVEVQKKGKKTGSGTFSKEEHAPQ
jgi:hypothetical protein